MTDIYLNLESLLEFPDQASDPNNMQLSMLISIDATWGILLDFLGVS